MPVIKEEFDTTPIAWEIYKLMYTENFKEICVKSDKTRKYIEASFIYNGKNFDLMKFSGDTDFNFGKGWSHSIQDKYKKLITESSISQEYKTMYSRHLGLCIELYKSVVNISIMPRNGNLQSAKKGIGNDRIDTFIWALDEYYSENSNLLTNNSSCEHMKILEKYLGVFGDVYNYCGTIYHINASLVDELIESGKKSIDSVERMISYMNLALRFWRQKIAYLKQKNQSEETSEISQSIRSANNLLEKFFAREDPV